MKRIFLFSVIFLFSLIVYSQVPDGYYDDAQGLTGEDLREALRAIITNGHTANNYNDLYTYYEQTDNFNGTGKVWDMYSMDGNGNAAYYYYYNNGDECGSYSGEGDCYNREHSVPQSWFNGASPMKADLFIVYPTDGYVNNRRSNYPYGEVDNPTWTSTNGSKLGPCSFPGYSGTVFEPIDAYKGDFARTYFYVATRYKNEIPSWNGASFSGDNLSEWAKNLFLSWHHLDPVSQKEIDRNNAVYNIQHNRNPFIDHPEWVDCIWGNGCTVLSFTSTPPTTAQLNQPYIYNITATGEDTTILTIFSVNLPSWLTFQSNYHTTATLEGTPNLIGSFYVSLGLTDGTDTVYQNFTITVPDTATSDTLLIETFDNCPPQGWIIYSAASSNDWQCSNDGYMYVNNYNSDEPADDWLITPPLNLNNQNGEILKFKTWTRYNDSNHPRLHLYYSTDYTGSGDPSNANWTELSYNYPDENSQTWTSSGNIDISQIAGDNVYFAFRYTSSGTGAGECELWKLDSVVIYAASPTPVVNNITFTSTPITNAMVNSQYLYNITVSADDTSNLNITAQTIPDWLTLDANYHTTASLHGIPQQPGSYDVVLEASDGTYYAQQQFTITVENTTIIAQKSAELFVFPNPARDFIIVKYKVNSPSHLIIKLYSPEGKLIRKIADTEANPGHFIYLTENISDINLKVLFLTFETETSFKTIKIIKK